MPVSWNTGIGLEPSYWQWVSIEIFHEWWHMGPTRPKHSQFVHQTD